LTRRNQPGQSDSETGNQPGLRTGGQTRQGGAGGQGSGQGVRENGVRENGRPDRAGQGRVGQGRAGGQGAGQGGPGGRGQGTTGRAGAPTGDFTVAFGHGHPLVHS